MTRDGYIEVIITEQMVGRAKARLAAVRDHTGRELNRFGSERARILVGYIGEEMFAQAFGLDVSDAFDFDMKLNGNRYEIKTISCKFKPYPNYLCTVNSCVNGGVHRQDADVYVFARVLNDFSKGWILGYMPCEDFFSRGRFVPKGTSPAPGVEFVKADATVIEIWDLFPAHELFMEARNGI